MTKKTIQVILTKDVEKLGKQGNIIRVKPGYIRNYLIPRKIAKIATDNSINQFELRQEEIKMKQTQFLENCNKNREILESCESFTIKKKVKEDGGFFGKLTKKHVLDLINDKVALTMQLDKNNLEIPEITQTGNYAIEVLLANNIIAKVNLKILAE